MNITREHLCDLTESSLNALSHQLLIVSDRRLIPAPRVPTTRHPQCHRVEFLRDVLSRVVRLAAVHEQLTERGQRERQDAKPAHLRSCSWQESELDRNTFLCRHDLHSDAIKVAAMGRALAPELGALEQTTALYADVVADRSRERVKQVLCRETHFCKCRTKLVKERVSEVSQLQRIGDAGGFLPDLFLNLA